VTTGTIIRVFDYASKTVSAWGVPGQFPSWSPDGSRIAYVPQLGGTLRLMNSDGTNQRALTSALRTYVEGPISWSSDSKWLLARSNAGMLDLVDVETGTVLPLPYSTTYPAGSLK
jgi:Tol biopolymer transport system component